MSSERKEENIIIVNLSVTAYILFLMFFKVTNVSDVYEIFSGKYFNLFDESGCIKSEMP